MNEDIITNDILVTENNECEKAEMLPPEDSAKEDDLLAPEEKAHAEEVLDAMALKNELEELKIKLSEKENALERMSREIGEFSEIFPEKQINSIPDSVWASVKDGIPLAAAYALYERKNSREQEKRNACFTPYHRAYGRRTCLGYCGWYCSSEYS